MNQSQIHIILKVPVVSSDTFIFENAPVVKKVKPSKPVYYIPTGSTIKNNTYYF